MQTTITGGRDTQQLAKGAEEYEVRGDDEI